MQASTRAFTQDPRQAWKAVLGPTVVGTWMGWLKASLAVSPQAAVAPKHTLGIDCIVWAYIKSGWFLRGIRSFFSLSLTLHFPQFHSTYSHVLLNVCRDKYLKKEGPYLYSCWSFEVSLCLFHYPHFPSASVSSTFCGVPSREGTGPTSPFIILSMVRMQIR